VLRGDNGKDVFGFIRGDDIKDAFVGWRIIGENDSSLVKNGCSLKKKTNCSQNNDVRNACSDQPDHAKPPFSVFKSACDGSDPPDYITSKMDASFWMNL
jgi:hypothetical protein